MVKRKEGWQQFLQNKIDMLNAYEAAKVREVDRPVKVERGNVAEAQFRAWLSSFLPKKYGVTSGYIISQGNLESQGLPHFDTIIFNKIDCPVLWVDENPDMSSQGRSKAIPVEYVHGVLEVKSRLTPTSAKKGMAKLQELDLFLSGTDPDGERYKKFLPKNFFSSLVFFEITASEQSNKKLLDKLISLARGYYGSVILSAEGYDRGHTGIMGLLSSETPIASNVNRGPNPLAWGGTLSSSVEFEGSHIGAMLTWSDSNFSRFAFDLLAVMNGTYDPGLVSSFHGMGFGVGPKK